MSETHTRAKVIQELYETINNPEHSFVYASTFKHSDNIHVVADMSDEDAFNVALSLLKKLKEDYSVKSILREIVNQFYGEP